LFMSFHVVSEVLKNSATKGEARLVLIALADCSNDEGVSWPSIRKICQKANISEQTAKKYLHAFEEIGLLSIEPRYDHIGRRTSNIYALNLDRLGFDELDKNLLYSVIPKSKKREGVGVNWFTPSRGERVHGGVGVNGFTPSYIERSFTNSH
jgi:hypothetical protein